MIRPLRRAHRAIWLLLALALPAGLIAALAVRPQLPERFERVAGAAREASR